MSSITDFISAAIEDKPVAASQAFAAAIQSKVDAAIEDKYNSVAFDVFNSGATEELAQNTEDSDYD